jgi:hypothetical protein
MAQEVEHLSSKCEALSSNPSTAKKQNKTKNYLSEDSTMKPTIHCLRGREEEKWGMGI